MSLRIFYAGKIHHSLNSKHDFQQYPMNTLSRIRPRQMVLGSCNGNQRLNHGFSNYSSTIRHRTNRFVSSKTNEFYSMSRLHATASSLHTSSVLNDNKISSPASGHEVGIDATVASTVLGNPEVVPKIRQRSVKQADGKETIDIGVGEKETTLKNGALDMDREKIAKSSQSVLRSNLPTIKQQANRLHEGSAEEALRKSSWSTKVVGQVGKIAQSSKNILVATGRLSMQFIRNPMIFEKWASHLWNATKLTVQHTWTGFKLLGLETRTSLHLLGKKLQGYQLSRRERRQMVRTTADLARVVPVLFFVLVPFMEFLLPVALKLFPNMLPSTFQDEFKNEEDMKKQLKLRIEMASFMQEMVEEMETIAKSSDANNSNAIISVDDVRLFMDRVRAGSRIDSETVLRVAKLFGDELTTDNMSRSQLVSICKYMGIVPFGGDDFLRFQLRNKINALRDDDGSIYFEGVDALNLLELKQACQDRGMRATGLTMHQLRTQLSRWIDLSVNKNVPLSLLILSRIFTLAPASSEEAQIVETEAALSEALSQMDEDVLHEALVKGAQSSGVTADRSTLSRLKLEAIQAQNELIEAEIEEKKRKAAFLEALRQKTQQDLDSATAALRIAETSLADAEKKAEDSAALLENKKIKSQQQSLLDEHQDTRGQGDEEIVLAPHQKDKYDIFCAEDAKKESVGVGSGTDKDEVEIDKEFADTIAAVKVLASDSSLEEEKSILEEMLEKQDEMDAVSAVATGRIVREKQKTVPATEVKREENDSEALTNVLTTTPSRDRTQKLLKGKLKSMLEQLEVDLESADVKIGAKLKLLDLDNDGKISDEELRNAVKAALKLSGNYSDESIRRVIDRLDLDKDGIIIIDELDEVLKTLHHKNELSGTKKDTEYF